MTIEQKAKKLISNLSFDDCIDLFNKLPKGHVMIDWIFDRMEELDPEMFDLFLDA